MCHLAKMDDCINTKTMISQKLVCSSERLKMSRGSHALLKWSVSVIVLIVSSLIENNVVEWYFWGFHTCYLDGSKQDNYTIFIAFHCILVSLDSIWRSVALFTSKFDSQQCNIDSLWHCLLWVKILKWKMPLSRQLERSKRRLKIPRDKNNAVERDLGVGFEREGLLLLEMLD